MPKEEMQALHLLLTDLGEKTITLGTWSNRTPWRQLEPQSLQVLTLTKFSSTLPEWLLGLPWVLFGLLLSKVPVCCLGSCLEERCILHMTEHRQ